MNSHSRSARRRFSLQRRIAIVKACALGCSLLNGCADRSFSSIDASAGPRTLLLDSGYRAGHRIFLTSATYRGDLANLGGADSLCTWHAETAELPGRYRAYITTADRNAAAVTGLPPWYNLGRFDNGPTFRELDQWATWNAQVFDEQRDSVLFEDDGFTALPGATDLYWTGSEDPALNCDNWTRARGEGAVMGRSSTSARRLGCGESAHLLCIEQ